MTRAEAFPGAVGGDSGEEKTRDLHDAEETQSADDTLQPGDTYLDGPYLVFTAQYHLRRGYCCNSGCRHCPYGAGDAPDVCVVPEPG